MGTRWSECAAEFWEWVASPVEWNGEVSVEWDGLPERWNQDLGRELAGILSPLHWAVAARIRGWRGTIRIGTQLPLSPSDWLGANLLGLAVPWRGPPEGWSGTSPWLTLSRGIDPTTAPPDPPEGEEVERVRAAWWALLNMDGDAHSVANHLGIHAFGMGGGSPADRALTALVETLRGEAGNESIDWPLAPGWKGGRVLLVDEHEHLGWGAFLARALGLGPGSVHAVKGPADTLPGGGTLLSHIAQGQPLPYAAVFLGLRRTVPKELIQMSPSGSAYWDATPEPVSEADNRSFLPRVLANRFPLLPVVLFSSTPRRDVVDRLRPFGNVVVDFAKPLLHGGAEATTRSAAGFTQAMHAASGIRAGGEALVRLAAVPHPRERLGAGAAVVDVLLDESGESSGPDEQKDLVLGGLVLEYPTPDAPKQLCERLWAKGLTWGLDREFNVDPTTLRAHIPPVAGRLKKSGLSKLDCAAIAHVFADLHIRASAVALRIPAQPQYSGFVDLRFRENLARLLELLVVDTIERVPGAELWVDVATRIVPTTDIAGQYLKYGRREAPGDEDGNRRIYALNSEEVHPIVDAICARRGVARLKCARASSLNAFLWSRNPRGTDIAKSHHPRQIHYLADWVVHLASEQLTEKRPLRETPTVEGWFRRGFIVTASPELDRVLVGLGERSVALATTPPDPSRLAAAMMHLAEGLPRLASDPYPIAPHLAHVATALVNSAEEPRVRKALFERMRTC